MTQMHAAQVDISNAALTKQVAGLQEELKNASASIDEMSERHSVVQLELKRRRELQEQQESQLSRANASLEVLHESESFRHTGLSQRLEVALREMQGLLQERDQLKLALD